MRTGFVKKIEDLLEKNEWQIDIIMSILSIISLFDLYLRTTITTDYLWKEEMLYVDLFISILFLMEFSLKYYFSDDNEGGRMKYFKHNWWYLPASIPIIVWENFEIGKILRIFRILRILRIMKLFVNESKIFKINKDYLSFDIFIIWIFVWLFSTYSFYILEFGQNPKIITLFDSLYFVLITMTTVGYGDIVPVTVEGRIFAMFLILFGVISVGILTALLSAKILRKIINIKE